MKIYLALTAIGLVAATAYGYWSGKGDAQTSFVAACTDTSFAVIYDAGSDAHRHFHCFELDDLENGEMPVEESMAGKLVL